MASIEEFINPKSMLTPGLLAPIIATASGACFSMFGLALPWTVPLFTLLFGAVVFYSKEFREGTMTRPAKALFYTLNCIILFTMAASTPSVLDRTNKVGSSTIVEASTLFVGIAHAQESKVIRTPLVIKMERPLFYDWTRSDLPSIQTMDKTVPTLVKYTVEEKSTGPVRNALKKIGFVVPEYEIKVKVDEAKIGRPVKTVTYKLPPGFFQNDTVTVRDETTDFRVNLEAWKPFLLSAEIELDTGKKIQVLKLITFGKPITDNE